MELITAKEVVQKLKQGGTADISTAYFSKLVTKKIIPFHTVPGKKRKMFIYDEAKKALIDSQDPTRDAQREANAIARATKCLNNDKVPFTKNEIDEINAHLPTDVPKELKHLLSDISDPLKRVRISKDFWASKRQELNYQIEKGLVMTVIEFKAVSEMLFAPLSQSMDDLPYMIKSRFPNTENDAIEWAVNHINHIKEEVQNIDIAPKEVQVQNINITPKEIEIQKEYS